MSKRKLIEVALPLDAINAQSAREKSIRKGHPSTLHLWWARRPLATARAVLFSQLVDDPSARCGDFLGAARAAGESDPEAVARARVEAERRRLAALADQQHGPPAARPPAPASPHGGAHAGHAGGR